MPFEYKCWKCKVRNGCDRYQELLEIMEELPKCKLYTSEEK